MKKLLRRIMWIVVSAVIFTFGCQTVKGIAGDSGWMLTELANNIQTETK